MNVTVRRMAVVSIILFLLLFAQVTRVQFFNQDFYASHDLNQRVSFNEYAIERGKILAGDTVIAQSNETGAETYAYEREYPEGAIFSNIHGYKSHIYGQTSLEALENGVLNGDDSVFFFRQIADEFSGFERPGGNILTTLDPELQVEAFEALSNSGSEGGVVALDPTTGDVLAQASYPNWDFNDIVSNNKDTSDSAWADLMALEEEANPSLDRSRSDFFAPGSTFKTVVAAAMVRELGYTADTMVPAGNSYEPPSTDHEITNSSDQCPQQEMTLAQAFALSCNTTFAQVCVEDLSEDDLLSVARDFGFGEEFASPLTTAASSVGDVSDPAFRAQSCFGQQDVRTTVMQNAMISAAVANDGKTMEPQLIDEIQDHDGSTMQRTSPNQHAEVLSAAEAGEMRTIMEAVVDDGTGSAAQLGGHDVGGKTGTAENTDEDGNSRPNHGWFISWADDEDGNPSIAVAVFLKQHGDGGATEASRIAGNLMNTHFDDD